MDLQPAYAQLQSNCSAPLLQQGNTCRTRSHPGCCLACLTANFMSRDATLEDNAQAWYEHMQQGPGTHALIGNTGLAAETL